MDKKFQIRQKKSRERERELGRETEGETEKEKKRERDKREQGREKNFIIGTSIKIFNSHIPSSKCKCSASIYALYFYRKVLSKLKRRLV